MLILFLESTMWKKTAAKNVNIPYLRIYMPDVKRYTV